PSPPPPLSPLFPYTTPFRSNGGPPDGPPSNPAYAYVCSCTCRYFTTPAVPTQTYDGPGAGGGRRESSVRIREHTVILGRMTEKSGGCVPDGGHTASCPAHGRETPPQPL